MKKVAFVLTLLVAAVCCGVQAQRPVGDTIWRPVDTDYFYLRNLDWFYQIENTDTTWYRWPYDPLIKNRFWLQYMHFNGDYWYYDGNYITGQQWYTDRPIKVVGIAICAFMQQPRDTTIRIFMNSYGGNHRGYEYLFFPNTNDTTMKGRITDSVLLYKPRTTADGPSMDKLIAAPWRMEQPHRYIHIPTVDTIVFFRSYEMLKKDTILPLYEVMFDSAVVVEDSFVVASTALNNEGRLYSRTVQSLTENMWLWNHPATRFVSVIKHQNTIIDSSCVAWTKYRQLEWTRTVMCTDSVWYRRPTPDSPDERVRNIVGSQTWAYPFFPIIEVGFDTVLCHEVSNLRVAMRGYGRATLMWDAGDGGPWIVAYGKFDDAWEDFTFDTVSSPTITLTGLEVGTQYFALVRGYCGVTDEYGEWTSPLEVEVYQSAHDPEGIEHPSDLGRFTRLVPNPAHGVVNVVSSFRLSRIELYALDGRKVLEQKADGISTVVDVSGLPSGTYIAALYLPHGVATKKLLVEN